MSIDAVASSMMKMLLFLTKALAKQKSCRCPTLKFSPPSVTTASKHKHIDQVLDFKTDFWCNKLHSFSS